MGDVIMKKLKIYLDTSVISHLDAHDAPEKMKETWMLWDIFTSNVYEVCVSDVTMEEIERCGINKKTVLFEYLSKIKFIEQRETNESLNLASKYIELNVLTEKSRDDCRHIALATVNEYDLIISWNFKHFVNIRIIDKIHAVNKLLGYKEIRIVPPLMLIGGGE
jgi:hypothetical protein